MAEIRKNRKPYDEANKKVLAEGEKDLSEELDRLTKAGKLDEAIATREVIKSFKETVLDRADAPVAVEGGAVPQKPLLERLEGKWAHPNSTHVNEFVRDGRVKELSKTGGVKTEGTVRVVADSEAEVRFANGWSHRVMVVDDNTLAVRVFAPNGKEHMEGFLKFRTR